MKILLIDDEKFTRLELGAFIKEEGYDILTASDGEEGLKLFEKELQIIPSSHFFKRLDTNRKFTIITHLTDTSIATVYHDKIINTK